LLVAGFALVLGGAESHNASAACPDTPAECLGSAGILAPERTVRMMGEVFIQGVWAKKATLRGVDLLPRGVFEP